MDVIRDQNATTNSAPGENEEITTPLLPIDGMPDLVQHFINKMHEIFRTPRDYWAGSAIMATALAIGNKFELQTKYKNNAVFWGMFVGDVSNGKTEPLDICLNYFTQKDNNNYKTFRSQLREFENNKALTRKEQKELGIENEERPECYQYILKDSTPEAMAEAHRINERGIMIYRDELKGWIDDFGRYSNSGEQSNMLSMWSQKGVTYNRKGSGILNIAKPVINVAGGIHRELLHTLATDNRADNGFLARMVAFFPDNTEKQPYNIATPDESLLNAWDDFMHELTIIKTPKTLILPTQTAKLYEAYFNDNVREINKEVTPYLKGVYGKLDIIVLRVAIIIRAMNYVHEGVTTSGIQPREMDAAIQITEYFRATALKVYRQIFGDKKFGTYDKKEIASWLVQNTKLTKTTIAREVLNSSRSQLDRITPQKAGFSLDSKYSNNGKKQM
ncbi:DUF3987 domain-containing protein [uncultured Draconibacterium sp.]|uniref:DUF3987 domain-containing protein n=1 Tax=uncultured Draconibacterium sp. TaxID=1573823 RepID=UPI0025CF92A5|nr:DUF3987 domain-containing protein [uncultured Draconibacterium sp.]